MLNDIVPNQSPQNPTYIALIVRPLVERRTARSTNRQFGLIRCSPRIVWARVFHFSLRHPARNDIRNTAIWLATGPSDNSAVPQVPWVSHARSGKGNKAAALGGLLTFSLPRLINFKIPLQPHQKYHTVWRTWLFIAYSGERSYQFSLPQLYISL